MELNNIASISCSICDEQTHILSKNIRQITSKYSSTEVYKFIEKFTRQHFDKYLLETSVICKACLDKINEYDLAKVTYRRVEKELCEKLFKTHDKILEETIIDEDDDSAMEIVQIFTAAEFGTAEEDLPFKDSATVVMNCSICKTSFNSLAEMKSHKHNRLLSPGKRTICVQILKKDLETDDYHELSYMEHDIDYDDDDSKVYPPDPELELDEVAKSRDNKPRVNNFN